MHEPPLPVLELVVVVAEPVVVVVPVAVALTVVPFVVVVPVATVVAVPPVEDVEVLVDPPADVDALPLVPQPPARRGTKNAKRVGPIRFMCLCPLKKLRMRKQAFAG